MGLVYSPKFGCFFLVNVGNYTSPMDASWGSNDGNSPCFLDVSKGTCSNFCITLKSNHLTTKHDDRWKNHLIVHTQMLNVWYIYGKNPG